MEKLFDLSEEYDAMLNQGLKISGEDKFYFMKGRVNFLAKFLLKNEKGLTVKKILDFGCGIGDTTNYLKEVFPQSEVVGVDTSEDAIEMAKKRFKSIRFLSTNLLNEKDFDLCYCNGVFHHIDPSLRPEAYTYLKNKLKKGGVFALFENNPINPGTRIIMNRIPFDKDAKPFTHLQGKKDLIKNGFHLIGVRFLFIYPSIFRFLRFTERYFQNIPIGAQYLVLSKNA